MRNLMLFFNSFVLGLAILGAFGAQGHVATIIAALVLVLLAGGNIVYIRNSVEMSRL